MLFMVIFMVPDPRSISSRKARKGARSAHVVQITPLRIELKGVFLCFFGLNLAVFIFLLSAWTMWVWSILAEKTCFGRIWPRKVGSVNFAR